MSDGFIRWYRESAATLMFDEQVSLFSESGIQLLHPVKRAAMVLDVDGNDVPFGREELSRLLGLRISSINVNWWLSADVNIVDEYSYEPLGCEIQTFWLHGLDSGETQTLETALLAAAAEFPVPTRALIVDRHGKSDPEDWDSVALYEGRAAPKFPDYVIAPDTIVSKLLQVSPELTREDMGSGLVRLTLPKAV
ncbi:hypothetical protein [Streptomyces orinoci]|uniref:Uncharacterized protein n=1 Tax=Streptomyces orinoci TaxID=67339 RepID=A0ABV3JVG5_STRON|nr:hypothetical protein [Streptomyces orinoci]